MSLSHARPALHFGENLASFIKPRFHLSTAEIWTGVSNDFLLALPLAEFSIPHADAVEEGRPRAGIGVGVNGSAGLAG